MNAKALIPELVWICSRPATFPLRLRPPWSQSSTSRRGDASGCSRVPPRQRGKFSRRWSRSKRVQGLIYLMVGIGLLACSHRPVEELTIADLAIKAAQKAKADVLAAELYRKAENYFLRAKRDYNEGYFEQAKKFATQARLLSEQAEYQAGVKQIQSKLKAAADSAAAAGVSPPAPPPSTEPTP